MELIDSYLSLDIRTSSGILECLIWAGKDYGWLRLNDAIECLFRVVLYIL